ncbi:MAG TPA: DUF2085 domain-containing protein [Anaerolineales bacterium]
MRLTSSHRKWWLAFLLVYGAFVFLPFTAPVLMNWKLDGLGKAVYFFYSFFCHQLPERSLFLFGEKWMYSFSEISAVWQNTDNPMILRQFIGTTDMGWKVAWSDRMISMYGGVWLAGLIWGLVQKRLNKVSIWVLILSTLPIILDGGMHILSDLNGLTSGFRFTNDWLAILTNHAFAPSFYLGDALGSFNSWMRWVTGLLFGFGLVWWAFPYIDESFRYQKRLNLD